MPLALVLPERLRSYSPERRLVELSLCPGHKTGLPINLVSSTRQVMGSGCRWVFTDGHAVMQTSRYFDSEADLGEVDFAATEARDWHDTDDDPDIKQRKQAEFLVYDFFNWSFV